MAFTINKGLDLTSKLLPLMVQQLRFRNRPNLQRPLPMHYKRKRIMAVCEPVPRPTALICDRSLEVLQTETSIVNENPYALFLAGRLRRNFAKHPMIAIFHTDSYSGREFLSMQLAFHDNNFPIKFEERINKKVAAAAFEGSRWAPTIPLFQSKTALGFCETKDVAKLIKLLKKWPSFVLMALIYEDRILHRDDVDRVVKLNNTLALYSQLSTSLNLPTMNLSQNLMMGQVTLTNSLSTYAKGAGEDPSTSSSSSSSDSDSDSSSSDSNNETDRPKNPKPS